MENLRLVVLQPKGASGPIIELAPVNVNNVQEAQAFWACQGESPNLVQEFLVLSVPDGVHDLIESIRDNWVDELEELLTAFYRAGLAKRR